MFYNSKENTYIQEGTAFTVEGVTYPSNWLNQATPEQKTQLGLEEVVATNQKADDKFYWVSEELNGASLTYVNTPKDLAGLKETQTAQVNATAYSLLLPSDWMVVRAAEGGAVIPEDWKAYRAAVRDTANVARTAIEAAADVPALEAIMVEWPKDPNYVAPVEEEEVVEQPTVEEVIVEETPVEPAVEEVTNQVV